MFGCPTTLLTCFSRSYTSVPPAENYPGENFFNEACKKGNVDRAEYFLRTNPNWAEQQATKSENYPLRIAAQKGHPKIIELLCDNGADPNQIITDLGSTALQIASQHGQTEAVSQLLSHGATIDFPHDDRPKPLALTFAYSHYNVTEILLDADENTQLTVSEKSSTTWEDLFSTIDSQGVAPLHIASYGGYTKTVNLILKYNVDVNLTTEDGDTALHLAAVNGKTGVIKEIMEQYSPEALELNKQNNVGMTPLMNASKMGNTSVVETFLTQDKHRVDFNTREKGEEGYTALHLAAAEGHADIARLLLQSGKIPDINAALNKEHNVTPLHLAILSGNPETVTVFLENHANFNLECFYNKKTKTPSYLQGLCWKSENTITLSPLSLITRLIENTELELKKVQRSRQLLFVDHFQNKLTNYKQIREDINQT